MLRVALVQINPIVGDLDGNARKIRSWMIKAEKAGAEVVVFPELAIMGYPPEDLLLKAKFIDDSQKKIHELANGTKGITAVVGFVDKKGKNLFNAAAVLRSGRIQGIYRKMLLPNYGVFDEKRYFQSGDKSWVGEIGGMRIGLAICEDVWFASGPIQKEVDSGAKVIFAINASPYHAGKIKERERVVRDRAQESGVPIIYINLVGGQDELVFDGQSIVVDKKGDVVARAKAFEEELLLVDIGVDGKITTIAGGADPLSFTEEIYQALVLGLRDYVRKNGFEKVVLGLSGGIDSSLVAAIAVDALGKENVIVVAMPSRFSSKGSFSDAKELAENLGIKLLKIPIEKAFTAYLSTLRSQFRGKKTDVTEENLQARVRGNLLMALSNKFGWMVLATGNKSEMSVGYATLYGDMAGGFAVIKDVPKTLVYKLAEWRNQTRIVIPKNVLVKAPSAELRFNQKDTDSLPSYDILDLILKLYVERDLCAREIIKKGFPSKVVYKVVGMVDRNEYKRRQAPPGVKITPKSFGRDRRIPITNRYKNNSK